jgi:hypothetical protein
MIYTDSEAWNKYPFHRDWFNKLWVSELFDYTCGPNAVSVPVDGEYVVRPIYNLHGMSAGAKFQHLTSGDIESVPPGYFWCERFYGEQLSVELYWSKAQWNVGSVFQACREGNELFRFTKWLKVQRDVALPAELNELWDCGYINIETVGGKIIEVHLRGSPDPIIYDVMIPVWSDTPGSTILELSKTHSFISSPDYVYGTKIHRTGFFVKCEE